MSDEPSGAPGTDVEELREQLTIELSRLLLRMDRTCGRNADRAGIARRLNVSLSSLYAYLSGKTLPRALVLDELLRILNATEAEFRMLSTLRDELELAQQAARTKRSESGLADPQPQQLPPDTGYFVGRAAECERLDTLLAEQDKTSLIVAIDGTAGVGKTALASRWAHRIKHCFPDGQLHVDLRSYGPEQPVETADALHGFLRALHVPHDGIPIALPEKVALFRTLVASRRILVFLDNARTVDQIRPLLPGGPRCLVLITTRNRLEGLYVREGAHLLTLDMLSRQEALGLLELRLGTGRLADEAAAADEIVTLCARLPLALGIAAARLARPGRSLDGFASQLRSIRLDALGSRDPDIDLRTVFQTSFTLLPQNAARVFQLLGVYGGATIGVAACAALCGISPTEARKLLEILTDAHMMSEPVPGRFSAHDLLREFARHLAGRLGEQERHTALGRILDHYVVAAIHASRLIRPHRMDELPEPEAELATGAIETVDEAMGWFDAELPVLNELPARASAQGFDEHSWKLAWACTVYLRRTGRPEQRVTMHRTGLAAALRAGDPIVCAASKRMLAEALSRFGGQAEAVELLHASLLESEAAGFARGVLQAHLALERIQAADGRTVEALHHARAALTAAREVADPLAQADGLTGLAKILQEVGETEEAVTHAQEALALYEQVGFMEGEADILCCLGRVEQALGRYDQAIAYLVRALEYDRLLGDGFWEAQVLIYLADAYEAAGDKASAHVARRDATALSETL